MKRFLQTSVALAALAFGLTAAEKDKDGFVSVFNGKDFDGWAGPVENYEVVDEAIVCKPGKGGTIYTKEEFGDFVVRLEFKVPSGGNNGRPSFKLPLAPTDYSVGGIPASTAEVIVSKLPTTKGAIWVEWIGRKPMQVMGLHVDADMEISKTSVEGFSWTVNGLLPGATLQRAWSLSEI